MVLSACRPEADPVPGSEMERQLQELLEKVQEGQLIEIPEGYYRLSRPLVLSHSRNVSIRGKGVGKTILDFSGMEGGKAAVCISADGAVLEDFSVFNPDGVCVSIQQARNIVLRRLKLGSDSTNNPGMQSGGCRVMKSNSLLIEQVEVSGSSEAGILVQQSENTILRNNILHHNATGIEIRNNFDTELMGNNCENNTVGILLNDLPELLPANGARCRIYNNRIINNNAPHSRGGGGLLAEIPSGTGIIILAGKEIEIFGNEISGHHTLSAAILNFLSFGKPYKNSDYDPSAGGVYFHDNRILPGKAEPDTSTSIGKRLSAYFLNDQADLLIDVSVASGGFSGQRSFRTRQAVCVRNNGAISIAGADLSDKTSVVVAVSKTYDCSLPSLQEIRLNTP